MCGVAGIVLAGGAPVDPAALRAMTTRLAHRGPDGDGFYTAPGCGLGHRRLAILDLTAAAAQPMVHPDAGTALTFNGEIYNFAALRDELAAAGERCASTGDTEVVLRVLTRDGAAGLRAIHGMFALGLWSPARRELLLARDRFGKKPLYYAPLGPDGREGLAFASELRGLLAHPRVHAERAIDQAAVAQYLVHEFVPAPRSILANVRKLRPGELLRWRDGAGYTLESYYDVPFGRAERGDPDELAREFLRLVQRATADRLVADVPVGVFLSGGLDSSLITACAAREHPRVKTFAIGFEDASFDESAHARAVARHLGTEHVERTLSAHAMLDVVPAALDWLDEPLADSSFLPSHLLAQVAREHVTVALGGDGGDELMAGYPTFPLDRALRWMPAWPARLAHAARDLAALAPPSDKNLSLPFKLKQLTHGLGQRGALRHARWMAAMLPEEIAPLAERGLRDALPHALDAAAAAARGTRTDFDAATAFYLRLYLGEGVLTKVDRATMRSSLEARAPLLDTRVVEFCLKLPPSLLVRGRTTKWLMRRALAPLVPPGIVERPKKGFGAPVGQWLRGPLAGMLRETLSPARMREAGWLDPAGVQALIDAHLAGRRDHRKPLYALLVLEHWRRRWFA